MEYMTDKDMIDRMKEIDKQRDELKQERREYESYLKRKKEEQAYEEHKRCEGKCYEVSEMVNYPTIEYLQILNVKENDINRARCLCIFNDSEERCGIQIMNLSLWSYNDNKFIHHGDEPLIIDVCNEISGQEFLNVLDEYTERFKKEFAGEIC